MRKGQAIGVGLIFIIIASVAYAFISVEQDNVVQTETLKILLSTYKFSEKPRVKKKM